MFENYYVRPVTIDRIRGSWIAPAIEQYVGWLAQQRFTSRSVLHRVPILVSFGEFAKAHGASELGHLPAHVEPFVGARIRERAGGRSSARRKKAGQEVRNPIRQMLRLAIPGYIGLVRPHKPNNPFERQAPRFLTHLAEEKDCAPARCCTTVIICISSRPTSNASASTIWRRCRQLCSVVSSPSTVHHGLPGRRRAMLAEHCAFFCATSIVKE